MVPLAHTIKPIHKTARLCYTATRNSTDIAGEGKTSFDVDEVDGHHYAIGDYVDASGALADCAQAKHERHVGFVEYDTVLQRVAFYSKRDYVTNELIEEDYGGSDLIDNIISAGLFQSYSTTNLTLSTTSDCAMMILQPHEASLIKQILNFTRVEKDDTLSSLLALERDQLTSAVSSDNFQQQYRERLHESGLDNHLRLCLPA